MSQDMDHLIVLTEQGKGEKISLDKVPMVLGRAAPADVIFNIASVSRRHAQVTHTATGFMLEDLGSSNGTYVNDERISAPTLLQNGDHVRLGDDLELRVALAVPVLPVEADTELQAPIFEPGHTDVPHTPPIPFAPEASPTGNSSQTPLVKAEVGSSTMMANIPGLPAQGSESSGRTMMMGKIELPVAEPPQLVINESGAEPRIFKLTNPKVTIGRQPENDIALNNRFVSRRHAELEKRGADYYLVPLPNISNALLVDGSPVMEPVRLKHGMKIRVGGWKPGEITSIDYLSPQESLGLGQQRIQFTEQNLLTIGRNPENKIVLPAPTVSGFHAEIEKIGQRFRVRDLRSSNGTFVNGQSISGEVWVQPGDAIQIGPYRFVVDENELSQSDQSLGGVKVEAFGLNKWVNKKLNILQDISLVFKPKEFIVVVGQSGGGKSTLVDAITGYRPATQGRVVVNDTIDVYKEFDAIRSTIGYVPQKDIIHMELTVFQALDYAAQLRMPADTTQEERLKRIDEVLEELDLSHRRDTQISALSGGQQKRVSIGVELLTKPGLFFLDEPTSGLDPGMETELMRLMRRLADQGRTIVMITHATKNVMLADKVVFLARGGYLTWFGPPEEALAYFDQYRTDRDRRSSQMEFDHIYTLLDNPELGKGPEWSARFREHEAHKKYIAEPLKDKGPAVQKKPVAAKAATRLPGQGRQVSTVRQFFILSGRNVKILTRDPFSMALLLLTAPLMASLDFLLAQGSGRSPLSFDSGNFNNMITTLITLTNTTILVGGLAFMRDLVKERDIYKRERMVNLKLSAYILSKIWIALILAFYQAVCFTGIRYLAFDMPGGTEELLFFFLTVFLLITAGVMMGFFASALAPNANSAPLILIMFIIPQMVMSGAIVPLPDNVTAPASSRWAFQASVAISGAGSDVAADACWSKTKEEQDDMTFDEKNEECQCMGENALRESSCNFPGLGKFYDVAIDEADPIKPAEPGPQPAEPGFPDPPAKPTDPTNILMLQQYLADLDTYNTDVDRIRSDYEKAIDQWTQEQEDYKSAVETYQEDLTELEVKRAIAVGSAEATIRRYKDDYGWTFIDKNDREKYLNTLYTTWAAQSIICLILFAGTVIMQKRHEA